MIEHKIGLDIGSTTVKLVVLNEENSLIYDKYKNLIKKKFIISLLIKE